VTEIGDDRPVVMRLPRLAFIAVLVAAPAVCGDPERCRGAAANYNQLVASIHSAIADYRRCLNAGLVRDECGTEFIELQVTHRDFEAAVAERVAKCASDRCGTN
jgi:hypothetical protein